MTDVVQSLLPPEAHIIADGRGVINYWNSSAQDIFGYTEKEALGVTIAELIVPPSLRERHRLGLARIAAGSAPVVISPMKTLGMHKDGTIFPIIITLSVWHNSFLDVNWFGARIKRDMEATAVAVGA